MENTLKSVIDQAKSVLVLLPAKPYFDQVAAGLALYLAIREDKDVVVVSPSPMTVEFNRLVGVNKIAQELGSKNLMIRFADYKANDIERVSYDIENGEFRLTVIPKPGVAAPKKEQAQLSYSGVAADTVLLIGGVNDTHFPALSSNDLGGAKLVHVGPRPLTLSSGKSVMSLARPASCASEIVAGLIKESGLKLDSDIATNLVMGIEEGSNKFAGGEITAETFQLFAELMRAGGRRLGPAGKPRPVVPIGAIPQKPPKMQPTQPVQPQQVQGQDEPKKEEAPKDWLSPKIYKGTGIR